MPSLPPLGVGCATADNQFGRMRFRERRFGHATHRTPAGRHSHRGHCGLQSADGGLRRRHPGAAESASARADRPQNHRTSRAHRQDDRRRPSDRVPKHHRSGLLRTRAATGNGRTQCWGTGGTTNHLPDRCKPRRHYRRGRRYPRGWCKYRGAAGGDLRARWHLHLRRCFPPRPRQDRRRVYRYRRAEPQEHRPPAPRLSRQASGRYNPL